MITAQIKPTSGLKVTHSKGYVLATSLLLLVVMVTLGVSMYGNVTVQEKMADNMRVKSRTLVAVKSAVQASWNYDVLGQVMVNPGDTSTNTIQINNEYDDDNVDLSGEIRLCYLGEVQCSGNSLTVCESCPDLSLTCKAFFAAGHIVEASTNTSTTIEQAGFMQMFKSDDVPNCNDAQLAATGMTSDAMATPTSMQLPSIEMPPVVP